MIVLYKMELDSFFGDVSTISNCEVEGEPVWYEKEEAGNKTGYEFRE
jgi:hypothetical protein